MRPRPTGTGRLLLVLVGLFWLLAGCATGSGAKPTPTSLPAPSPTAEATPRLPDGWTGGTIHVADLPPEARDTLHLIAAGGPFPYRQDGQTFGNREGLLPARPSGAYREYTVETPGSPDRGARRLVLDAGRDAYYTDDHYASFRVVIP